MKIVVVNGQGGSGKSTFEILAFNYAKKYNKRIKICSTIDYVKEFASMCGWNGEKDNRDRKFLSDLKDALTQWKDIPFSKVCEKINYYSQEGVDLLFIDCREPEEIQRFVEKYNALTILITRGKYVLVGNHADDNVFNYEYDIEISNNRGLKELEEEAQIFVETFLLGGQYE